MRVRMKVAMAGPNESYTPGKEYDFPDAVAKAMIDDGRAEAIAPTKGAKRATATRGKGRSTATTQD